MGMMIEAGCECGYSSEVICQGGGFGNFWKKDLEPALCKKCRMLIVLNYKESDPQCPNCHGEVIFYNDPSLQKNPDIPLIGRQDIQWGDFVLPDVYFLCPQCFEMKMKFFEAGCWD